VTLFKKYDKTFHMIEDPRVKQLHDIIMDGSIDLVERYPSQMVAATLLAAALRMYKTAIPDPVEYDRMVKFVLDQDVDPFNRHTLH
tara:strand:+ start:624 stop:881 length:258 start_codon:yes stop_codon:yes gene_type:complete